MWVTAGIPTLEGVMELTLWGWGEEGERENGWQFHPMSFNEQ